MVFFEFKLLSSLTMAIVFIVSFTGNSIGANLERPVESPSLQQKTEKIKVIEGVKGKVVSEKGNPIEGVFIQVESIDIPSLPVPEIAIITDSKGNYVWRLEPGRYKVSALKQGYKVANKKVIVRKGEATVVNFTLKKIKKNCNKISAQ